MKDFSKFHYNTVEMRKKKVESGIPANTTYDEFIPTLYSIYNGDEQGVNNYLNL